jgi:CheY-like chemotaxis protein
MCHVLIIEDEPFVAMALQLLLRDAGATSIDFADSKDDAVEAARARRPSVITSDVRLRVGRGPDAVRCILAEHGLIPVIYITASPEECHECDPDYVFSKPMNEAKIEAVFRRIKPAT